MNVRKNLIPLSLIAVACAMQASSASSASQESLDAKLDKRLAGRAAEAPRTCVNSRDIRGSKSYGDDVIVFQGANSSLVYVNHPIGGCQGLNDNRAIKIKVPSTQICRGDLAEVFDPVTHTQFGACSLGEFVPYRRQKG
jgi:hypothetical protein